MYARAFLKCARAVIAAAATAVASQITFVGGHLRLHTIADFTTPSLIRLDSTNPLQTRAQPFHACFGHPCHLARLPQVDLAAIGKRIRCEEREGTKGRQKVKRESAVEPADRLENFEEFSHNEGVYEANAFTDLHWSGKGEREEHRRHCPEAKGNKEGTCHRLGLFRGPPPTSGVRSCTGRTTSERLYFDHRDVPLTPQAVKCMEIERPAAFCCNKE